MKVNTDTLMYRRQMVNMANEAKKQLVIPASIILNESNDMELGKIIRGIYNQRCKDADAHIEYIKSLEN
jgi:hypothetical protein